jgi:hypothetical protein
MECRFSIKAKSFRFSSKEGPFLFWLEERRKKFIGYILVSTQCASWLTDTVEAACQVKENIAKPFHEGDKALMVHGGGRKGAVWLPKGRDERGWRCFAGELRRLLASFESRSEAKATVFYSSPSMMPLSTKLAEAGATADCSKDRSFAEVLRSKPRSELEGRSRCEVKNGGVDLGIDEDGVRLQAAGSEWKTRGSAVKDWASHLLGIVQLGLGRVVAGLLEGLLNGLEGISICKRIRAVLKSLDGPMGCGVGPPPLRTSSGRVKGLRKVQLKPSRIRKGVGVGLLLKSKRETCLKRSRRVRPLASENTSLGATLQAPKVRLGASADVSSMPKQAFGGVSGSVGAFCPCFSFARWDDVQHEGFSAAPPTMVDDVLLKFTRVVGVLGVCIGSFLYLLLGAFFGFLLVLY